MKTETQITPKGQYTKGKWKVSTAYHIFPQVIIERKNMDKVQITQATDILPEEEALANAKLIASAPELLKRLNDIIDAIERNGLMKISTDSLYYIYAKKAIKEATE